MAHQYTPNYKTYPWKELHFCPNKKVTLLFASIKLATTLTASIKAYSGTASSHIIVKHV